MMNLNYVLYAFKYYLCTKYYALPVLMTHPDYIHIYLKIPSFYVKKAITNCLYIKFTFINHNYILSSSHHVSFPTSVDVNCVFSCNITLFVFN